MSHLFNLMWILPIEVSGNVVPLPPPSLLEIIWWLMVAVFSQSNATLAQNINQLFSPRHFTVILLSQKIFANCNQRSELLTVRHFGRIVFATDLSESVFCNNEQVGFESLRIITTFLIYLNISGWFDSEFVWLCWLVRTWVLIRWIMSRDRW